LPLRQTRMLGVALLILSGLATASQADPDPTSVDADESGLEVVLIQGVQPGPGLWKVSSDEHVMWILGEISPYPRKVKWRSKAFERLMDNSQELLLDFSGFWSANHTDTRRLAMAELLPAGVRLKDVISPQLHQRVEVSARRFGALELEDLRPFAATNRLVVSAMDSMDMKSFSARFTAEQLARKRHLKVTRFAVPELPFDDRLKNWQDDSNVVCLERLLAAIGDGGAGVRRLANAWSEGEIGALRQLVPLYSFSRDGFRADECAAAMHGGKQQAADYKRKRTQLWLQQAKRALRNNLRTMAVVPMSELFAADGYLAALRAAGYEIEEPL
jgi:TraB family protein